MTSRAKRKSWTCLACLSGLAWLSGCGLSVGPRVKDRIVFVRTRTETGLPVVAARVCESKRVEIEVEYAGQVYRDKANIGGWFVMPPEAVKKSPTGVEGAKPQE